MQQPKTILVVDDEEKIIEVIQSYLQHAGYRVVSACTGKEALELFDRANPVLVILDLMLPDMSGEDVCRTIRRKSRVPVIMLSAKVEDTNIVQGLEIGADDYVTKPFSLRQLLARVDAVLRRVTNEAVPVASSITYNNGELMIDSQKHEVRKRGELVALTPNEFNLFMTMVKYPLKVFTRDELITLALGDDEYQGFERAVDTHIKNIRQKLEDNPKTPKYVITVYGVGYKFGGEYDET